jgi:hypothetical protein
MGALPQPLEVIFEVQRKGKGVMKKKKEKNKLSNLQNFFFFLVFFLLFGPSYFQTS